MCQAAVVRQNVSEKVIAVLGASGATGQLVVAEALAAGHDVVALVRRAHSFQPAAGLREALWPDVADELTLSSELRGVNAVISVLGGAGRAPMTVCADAIRTTVPAMSSAGVRRLVAVSAYGVLETHDKSLYSMAVWWGVGEKMKDKEAMERIIVASPLDWTIVRPPALRNTPAQGKYQVGDDLPIRVWHGIGRADLAAFLVGEAEESRFVHHYPRIHR